jgi:hypothetical protein
MEENAVELYDYLRVIWKRKIFIIVVTLVCIGVGVTKSSLKLPLPVTYCAEMTLKIGKKVKLVPTSGAQSTIAYIENPEDLVRTIPLNYYFKTKESSGYHLDVKQIGALAMLKLTLKGPDRGVERILEELVVMLVDEHSKKAKASVAAYKNFMKTLEADAEVLRKDIFLIDKSIKEMKNKEGEYLVKIETGAGVKQGDKTGGDRSAFLNMLYLKTIDKERELSSSRSELRSIQMRLTLQQITLGNLEEYKTEKVGGIKFFTEELEKDEKRTTTRIIEAGVVGLIMSLFIAFFMEYIGESKSRRKGK